MKRAFTLLEIMIAILLITIITGAIGYNMRGSLEKGKAFRTERAQEELRDLLRYAYAETRNADSIMEDKEKALQSTGLAKNPKKLLEDGWGVPFDVKFVKTKDDFEVSSKKLQIYLKEHHLEKSKDEDE